jgi:predicted PurR-regulated permease PerM
VNPAQRAADAPHADAPGPRFVGQVLTATAVAIGLLLLVALLWIAREVVLLLFAGLLFAVLLRSAGSLLRDYTPLGDRSAVAIALGLLVGFAVLAGWLAGPGVIDEVRDLQSGLTRSVSDVRAQLEGTRLGEFMSNHSPEMSEDDYQKIWSRVGGLSASALGALGSLIVVLLVGVFFAFNPGLYIAGLLRMLPLQRRPRASQVIDGIGHTLRWWMVGQLISMAVLWLSTWLMLSLLGVPLAFILGLLTGLLTFIPYLGPLIALVPIALVAFLESPSLALLVIGMYFVIQNLEANVLMPLVFQRLVHLPAALTVSSQLLMGTLAGLIGIVLATPLLAVLLVLIQRLYVEDVLGDSMERPAIDGGDDASGGSGDRDTG